MVKFSFHTCESNYFKDPFFYIMLSISILFSYLFSYYTILKYVSLNATAYDLGIYVSILENTMHGHVMYANPLLINSFSEHFSPFLFVIYPIYWFFPYVKTLLIMQSVMISFSGLVIYLLAREIFFINNFKKDILLEMLALFISTSYILSPYIESPLSFDFHLMPFLILFVPLSFYFFMKKYKILNLIVLILIISLHSLFVIMVFFIISYQFIFRIRNEGNLNCHKIIRTIANINISDNLKKTPKSKYVLQKIVRSKTLIKIIITLILLVGYLYFASLMKTFIASGAVALSPPSTMSTGSVSSSLAGLFTDLFTRPMLIESAFLINFPDKIIFAFYAFANTGFLVFLDPLSLLMDIPYFLYAYLSSYGSYYSLGYQYSTMIIPFIFIGALFGIRKIVQSARATDSDDVRRTIKKILVGVISIVIVSSLFELPLDPISPRNIFIESGSMANFHEFAYNNGSEIAFELQKEIGESDPYLLTINNLYPVFAKDTNAYVIAFAWNSQLRNLIYGYHIEYLVNQPDSFWSNQFNPSMNDLIDNNTFISHYGVYMESFGQDGVIVYKLNYTGLPVLMIPYSAYLPATSFYIAAGEYNYSIVNGSYVYHNTTMGTAWFGPYTTLLPGRYNITYYLESVNSEANSSILLDVTTNAGTVTLNQTVINSSELPNGDLEEVTLHLTLNETKYSVEFRGMAIDWTGTLIFKGVKYSVY